MAVSYKLAYVFEGSNGKDLNISYNYADPEVESTDVIALANGIIENRVIFTNAPVAVKSAKLIATETTSFNVN